MKRSAVLLVAFIIIFSATSVSAKVSNNIKIDSDTGDGGGDVDANVSTSNDLDSSFNSSTDSKTNVNIEHSGEGNTKSEITINGKTYTLEGSGSIKMEDGEINSETPTPNNSSNQTTIEDVLGDSATYEKIEERKTIFFDIVVMFFSKIIRKVFSFL